MNQPTLELLEQFKNLMGEGRGERNLDTRAFITSIKIFNVFAEFLPKRFQLNKLD